MRGPWSAIHLITVAPGSPPRRRSRKSSRSCSKSRDRPAVSSRSHWSRAWKCLAAAVRPIEPQRLAELRISAGQRELVDLELAAEHGEADAAVHLEQFGDPVDEAARRARRRRTAGAAPAPRPWAPAAADRRAPRRACRCRASAARRSRPASGWARCRAADRRCGAGALREACSNKASRTSSGTAAFSMSAHSRPMSNSRSAAMKQAATWPKAAPPSSIRVKGATMPSRLTMRLATLVAMISFFRRWPRIAFLCFFCIAGGKAASSSASSVGSLVKPAFSIAACSRIFAVESRTASSGRVRP